LHWNGSRRKLEFGRAKGCRGARKKSREVEKRGSRKAR